MKNRMIPILIFALTFSMVNVYAKNHAGLVLQQETDSMSVSISSAYSTNIKQLELSGLAIKNGNGKTKALAENLRDYFIKSNADLRNLAKQKKINLPLTKPDGGMRPDGRIDSAPENMKDTSRNESGAGEAGNTGVKGQPKPELVQSILDLSKLKGADFNKSYSRALSNDFNHLISLYTRIAESKDGALKSFAKDQLNQLNRFSGRLK